MTRLGGALALAALVGCATARPEARDTGFRAGTAKVKITPAQPGFMSGFGSRGNRMAEGTLTDLWLRALALEDAAGTTAVVVAADVLGFPPGLGRSIRDQARARFGLDDSRLLLAASHTHGGPALPERPPPDIHLGLDPEQQRRVDAYGAWLEGQVLDVIGQALARREPARLSFGRGEAYFGVNRRVVKRDGSVDMADNKTGPRDPDLPVLWVTGMDGGVRAVVFTYACHGTARGGGMAYNGDWSGYASDALERALPGATALYVAGAAGDIHPSPGGKVEWAVRHGETAAAVVLATRATSSPIAGPLRAVHARIELPLGEGPLRDRLEAFRDGPPGDRSRHARAMLALQEAGTLPRAVPLPIQIWKLGSDLTLVSLGGEATVEYALRLKRELGAAPGARIWVAAYANEVPCYIPSEAVLAEGGYEPGWDKNGPGGRQAAGGSMVAYGWPVPFAPGLEAKIVAAVHALLRARPESNR